MLFNGVELKVFNFESEYWICARTKEEALKYHLENVDNGEDWEVTECDLEKEGSYDEYDLESIIELIRTMEDDNEIRIFKSGDTWHVFYSFKDAINHMLEKHTIDYISMEPFEIAWSE